MVSIAALLAEAAQMLSIASESPALDAEVLLCLVLGKPRVFLRTWPDKWISTSERDSFYNLIKQRQQGMPIAYLTGSKEFWSRDFLVNPDVLIPRPDTELLIELSLERLPMDKPSRILDLGTGSGILAVTLAAELPSARIIALDTSLAALKIAQRNADLYAIESIQFRQSYWFSNILPDERFDLIVSNPPYIAEDDAHLSLGDLRFEPKNALCAAEQGLGDIRKIIEDAKGYLITGGYLFIEHGYDQQQPVQKLFNANHYHEVMTYQDLAGQPRVTGGKWF